jgi:hypothetical protein
MQLQKATGRKRKATGTTGYGSKSFLSLNNLGKIMTAAMQWLQGGLAWRQLALHLQQDYLAVIRSTTLRF